MAESSFAITDGVERLGLSASTRAVLDGLGVRQVADLVVLTERRLIETRKLGTPQVREVEAALAAGGLRLGMRAAEVARQMPQDAPAVEGEADGAVAQARHDVLVERDVEALGVSARTAGALREAGVVTIGGVVALDDEGLLALDGIGPKSLDEIRARLAAHGLAGEGEAG